MIRTYYKTLSYRIQLGGKDMNGSFIVIIAIVLIAMFACPTYGAALQVTGKYVANLIYDGEMCLFGGPVFSVNPGSMTTGIDLPGMSALYLTFDFPGANISSAGLNHDNLLRAHLPLVVFKDTGKNGLSVIKDPDDDYFIVLKTHQVTLSLTDASDGDYIFKSLKDPLGLIREIDAKDMTVLKITGEPYGINVLGYLIDAAPAGDEDRMQRSRYGVMRATYDFPSGLDLGFTGGIHLKPLSPFGNNGIGVDEDINRILNSNWNPGFDINGNISMDAKIPVVLTQKGSLQGAFAVNTSRESGKSYTPKHAFSLKARRLRLGTVGLAGDIIAVEPGFSAVAHKRDSSDIHCYEGKRYIRGEIRTTAQAFKRDIKIAFCNEYITNYDGSQDNEGGSSKNKISGEIIYNFSPRVTLTLDGYLNKVLADTGDYYGDNTIRTRAKISYKSPRNNEIWGRAWGATKKYKTVEGKAHKFEGGIKIKPPEHGKLDGILKGKCGYEKGSLTFPSYTSVGRLTSKIYGEVYAELKHGFIPDGLGKVDISLAGLAKYSHRQTRDPRITLVSYGKMDIIVNERVSNTTALLFAKEPKKTSHYAPTLYNKLDCRVSANSILNLGYTLKGGKGTFDATYTVILKNAGIQIGYGKTGLRDECTDTNHKGKPWAWLCSAEIEPKPRLFTLTITIPF